ncbi:MAG: hypothetical protein HYT80_11330 [Euryarchaeota archaeon]|nr:hypothetical protein [Euryarchaeota archaeon]
MKEPQPAPAGPIVVDGSNVAMQRLVNGKPTIENIKHVHDELVKLGYGPVVFVDASLRHRFPEGERQKFEKWYQEGFVVQAPKGVPGDEAILEFASRKNAPVLSNDTYEEYQGRYPWITDRTRRVPFNLVHGELILYRTTDAGRARQAQMGIPEPPRAPPPPAAKTEPAPPAPAPTPEEEKLRNEFGQKLMLAFNRASPTGEPVILDDFLREFRRIVPGFRPGDYGYSKPSQLIADFPELLELDRRSDHGEVSGLDGPAEWPIHVCKAFRRKAP